MRKVVQSVGMCTRSRSVGSQWSIVSQLRLNNYKFYLVEFIMFVE
jgi:hypothetical protein